MCSDSSWSVGDSSQQGGCCVCSYPAGRGYWFELCTLSMFSPIGEGSMEGGGGEKEGRRGRRGREGREKEGREGGEKREKGGRRGRLGRKDREEGSRERREGG